MRLAQAFALHTLPLCGLLIGSPLRCNALPCITGHVLTLWRVQQDQSIPYRSKGV